MDGGLCCPPLPSGRRQRRNNSKHHRSNKVFQTMSSSLATYNRTHTWISEFNSPLDLPQQQRPLFTHATAVSCDENGSFQRNFFYQSPPSVAVAAVHTATSNRTSTPCHARNARKQNRRRQPSFMVSSEPEDQTKVLSLKSDIGSDVTNFMQSSSRTSRVRSELRATAFNDIQTPIRSQLTFSATAGGCFQMGYSKAAGPSVVGNQSRYGRKKYLNALVTRRRDRRRLKVDSVRRTDVRNDDTPHCTLFSSHKSISNFIGWSDSNHRQHQQPLIGLHCSNSNPCGTERRCHSEDLSAIFSTLSVSINHQLSLEQQQQSNMLCAQRNANIQTQSNMNIAQSCHAVVVNNNNLGVTSSFRQSQHLPTTARRRTLRVSRPSQLCADVISSSTSTPSGTCQSAVVRQQQRPQQPSRAASTKCTGDVDGSSYSSPSLPENLHTISSLTSKMSISSASNTSSTVTPMSIHGRNTHRLSSRIDEACFSHANIEVLYYRPRAAQALKTFLFRQIDQAGDRFNGDYCKHAGVSSLSRSAIIDSLVGTNTNVHLEGETSCPICHEDLLTANMDVVETYCGHRFHNSCLREALSFNKTCPICRACLLEHWGKASPPGSMRIRRYSLADDAKSCIMDNQDQKFLHNCNDVIEPAKNVIDIFYFIPAQRHSKKNYDEFSQRSYLPDNEEGQQLLVRLKYAFMHGLMFRIVPVPLSSSLQPKQRISCSAIPHITTLEQKLICTNTITRSTTINIFQQCNSSDDKHHTIHEFSKYKIHCQKALDRLKVPASNNLLYFLQHEPNRNIHS